MTSLTHYTLLPVARYGICKQNNKRLIAKGEDRHPGLMIFIHEIIIIY